MRVCSLHAITNISKYNTVWFSKFQIMRYVDQKMWVVECIVEFCFEVIVISNMKCGGIGQVQVEIETLLFMFVHLEPT